MQHKLTDFFDPASKPTGFPPHRATFQEFISKQEKSDGKAMIRNYVEWVLMYTNWANVNHDGWTLPRTKQPRHWCGEWKKRGCTNAENHEKSGYGETWYVQQFQSSCYRAECSTCYYQSIIRQANRSARRVKAYALYSRRQQLHVGFSVPHSDYGLTIEEMRKKIRIIMKDLGLIGGAAVFHPYRMHKKENRFYYSPHFHVIGFGNIRGKTRLTYEKHGWVILYFGPPVSFPRVLLPPVPCRNQEGIPACDLDGLVIIWQTENGKGARNQHLPMLQGQISASPLYWNHSGHSARRIF